MTPEQAFKSGGRNPSNGLWVREWFACGSVFTPNVVMHEGKPLIGIRQVTALDVASGFFMDFDVLPEAPDTLRASRLIPFMERIAEKHGLPSKGWVISHSCWLSSSGLLLDEATADQGEFLQENGCHFGSMPESDKDEITTWGSSRGLKILFDGDQIFQDAELEPESVATSNPEPTNKMIDAAPAKFVRDLVERTIHWYLPESQRERFLRIGEDYSYLDAHEWEAAYQMARVKMVPCVATMKDWQDRPETDDLLATWDDEVLFFYVLRFQFVWVRLYSVGDDAMIPALDDFWPWAMEFQQAESWIHYTFPTVVEFEKLDSKPRIWKFFSPCDIPITKK